LGGGTVAGDVDELAQVASSPELLVAKFLLWASEESARVGALLGVRLVEKGRATHPITVRKERAPIAKEVC